MRIISRSPADTRKIARRIAAKLKPADILCLFGPFGAGKTVFAKGLAQGLGIKSRDVISPSFVLLRRHNYGRLPLFHFDLYRLKSAQDILDIGYEDFFYAEGITVVEWADRLKHLLPREFLKIELSLGPDSERRLQLRAFGSRYKKLLKDIDLPRHSGGQLRMKGWAG